MAVMIALRCAAVERPPLSCHVCGKDVQACDDTHHCPHDYNCEAHCCVAPPPECVDGADCDDPAGDCKKAECKGGVCVTTADNSDVSPEGAGSCYQINRVDMFHAA
jgi:hypothetical protein